MLINELTVKKLDLLINRKPSSILITGSQGSGKSYVAEYLASQLLEIDSGLDHSIIKIMPEDEKVVTIEQIRTMRESLTIKQPGNKAINRVVTIFDAQTMQHEAQNALLKILEEPPDKTVFIIVATTSSQLLPTIISRVSELDILPVSKESVIDYIKDNGLEFKQNEFDKLYLISEGRAGLLLSLIKNEKVQITTSIDHAKSFLAASKLERLIILNKLTKDSNELFELLNALQKISYSSLCLSKNAIQQSKWLNIYLQVVRLKNAYTGNASRKLIGTELSLII